MLPKETPSPGQGEGVINVARKSCQSAGGPRLQYPDHLRGAPPQALEVVKFPLVWRKNVDYYVAEIQKYPSGRWRAFSSVPRYSPFLQGLGKVLFQTFYLAGRFSRHNDEVVGKGCQAAKVEKNDVLGQFVCGDVHDKLRHFQRFQLQFLRASGGGPLRT